MQESVTVIQSSNPNAARRQFRFNETLLPNEHQESPRLRSDVVRRILPAFAFHQMGVSRNFKILFISDSMGFPRRNHGVSPKLDRTYDASARSKFRQFQQVEPSRLSMTHSRRDTVNVATVSALSVLNPLLHVRIRRFNEQG